jgi:hypothetical protein
MKKHTLTYTDPNGLEFKVQYPDLEADPDITILKAMIKGIAAGAGFHSTTINEYFPEK